MRRPARLRCTAARRPRRRRTRQSPGRWPAARTPTRAPGRGECPAATPAGPAGARVNRLRPRTRLLRNPCHTAGCASRRWPRAVAVACFFSASRSRARPVRPPSNCSVLCSMSKESLLAACRRSSTWAACPVDPPMFRGDVQRSVPPRVGSTPGGARRAWSWPASPGCGPFQRRPGSRSSSSSAASARTTIKRSPSETTACSSRDPRPLLSGRRATERAAVRLRLGVHADRPSGQERVPDSAGQRPALRFELVLQLHLVLAFLSDVVAASGPGLVSAAPV